ncbi:SLAP domain-containing protein [Companilactobacillus nantensis]|uniref:S-layer protein C-terminal domain-containing protein n=1 Tax=Companilactobacillus nantensis DSM 16982 TaxID=1423774 RepID=A0A0R1WGI2_9LACO|nr:SLAP domain-containing protein [Companilactobacillus nantensis]KRM17146.1 hypothetical protein FD31_GL000391 [Companilactobacillus nantensis DSM 16982]GEO64083.1 hypothetical protein LNA01_12660 [Companilactobacillus nantensis]
MRFQQLKHGSNIVLRKKMYKSGKNWVTKSTLGLVGGLALFGVSQLTVVKADVTPSQATSETQSVNQSDTTVATEISVPTEGVTSEVKNRAVSEVTESTTPTPATESAGINEVDGSNSLPTVSKDQASNGQATNSDVDEPNSEEMSGTWGSVNWEVKDDTAGRTLYLNGGTLDNTSYDGTTDNNPWSESLRSTIKRISFGNYSTEKVVAGTSTSGLFRNFTSLETIFNEENFDTTNTTDMSYMFAGDSSLKNVNTSPWMWTNMTNFSHMFYQDTSLEAVSFPPNTGMSQADKSKMDYTSMFEGDSKIKLLQIALLDMSETDKNKDFLKGVTDLQYLVLSNRSKLTNSGLGVGMRDNRDMSAGSTGWISSSSPSEYKNTADLVAIYDGISDDVTATAWTNYKPYIIKIYAEDMNGNSFGDPIEINLPKGDLETKEIDFSNQFSKLDGYGKFISGDESTGKGSYAFEYNPEQITDPSKDNSQPYYIANDNDDTGFTYITSMIGSILDIEDDHLDESLLEGTGSGFDFHLVYDKKPSENNSNSGSGSGSTSTREVEGVEETLNTYKDAPEVQLYDDNGETIADRKLAPNSDWYTDSLMTLNGIKYYRVATNQWVKENDVYLYYNHAINIQVNNGTIANLVTSSGKAVTDRALQANSDWYTDRYTYINNVKYYRVATNEFVCVNDVQEY